MFDVRTEEEDQGIQIHPNITAVDTLVAVDILQVPTCPLFKPHRPIHHQCRGECDGDVVPGRPPDPHGSRQPLRHHNRQRRRKQHLEPRREFVPESGRNVDPGRPDDVDEPWRSGSRPHRVDSPSYGLRPWRPGIFLDTYLGTCYQLDRLADRRRAGYLPDQLPP
jgi:hypothetical protein